MAELERGFEDDPSPVRDMLPINAIFAVFVAYVIGHISLLLGIVLGAAFFAFTTAVVYVAAPIAIEGDDDG